MMTVTARSRAIPAERRRCNYNKLIQILKPHIQLERHGCSFHSLRCCSSSRLPASVCSSGGRSEAGTMWCLALCQLRWLLGLELSKPFAISAAFASLGQWRVITAARVGARPALLAIGYAACKPS